jgi:Integral membrane protein, interacts with FtsH
MSRRNQSVSPDPYTSHYPGADGDIIYISNNRDPVVYSVPPPHGSTVIQVQELGHTHSARRNPTEEDFIRKGFVKKVYGILIVILLFTAGFVIAMNESGASDAFIDDDGSWSTAGGILFYLCIGIIIAISIVLICYPRVARRVPWNYLLLGIYTLALSFICLLATVQVGARYVYSALALTLGMTALLTLYAVKSKREITFAGASKFICVWLIIALPTMTFLFIWAFNFSATYTFLSILFVLLYGFYIVWDTKLIIGQKKSGCQLSTDDYILGALFLYTDIIGLFLNLLSLMTNVR